MTKLIPLCHKCSSAYFMADESGFQVFYACGKNDEIFNWTDAKEKCPLLSEEFDVQSPNS